jgi:glycosyltransferase involved in cell wall biosynthesis
MRISFSTLRANFNRSVGYGYAGYHIINSLQKLGHETPYQDPNSLVQLNFSQPNHFKLHRKQYQIGYTPWESTKLPKEWYEKLFLCNEIWTTSDWCKEVFESNGAENVRVFPHGIDSDLWVPKKRIQSDKIRFLHLGEPAPRKGGQMVVDAFIYLFGNNPDYELTIKAYKNNTTRVYNNYIDKEIIGLPHEKFNNIKLIEDDYDETQLRDLYYKHDVLVYPSYGEGFGFIPLQALASGMPVISTYDWAHYKNFIGPLKLKSKLIESPWPFPHPGKVFEPNYEHLLEVMKDFANNSKPYSSYYYAQSTKIHKEYDWLQLTDNAFKHIVEKFS